MRENMRRLLVGCLLAAIFHTTFASCEDSSVKDLSELECPQDGCKSEDFNNLTIKASPMYRHFGLQEVICSFDYALYIPFLCAVDSGQRRFQRSRSHD